ncbi:MAG: hypothetical protein R3F20_00190 [Planctomycetota bacterium]
MNGLLDGLAILVSLEEEAAPLRRLLAHRGETDRLRVFGAGPLNAARALDGLEVRGILHLGFAGGLRADQAPGDRFVLRSARDGEGEVSLPTTPLGERLRELGAREAAIFTAPGPLDAAAKRAESARGRSDLVDMESAILARAALERGLAYTGFRAVSDALAEDIPAAVTASWDGERFRTGRILRGLLARPSLLPELLRLRRRSLDTAEILAATVGAALA